MSAEYEVVFECDSKTSSKQSYIVAGNGVDFFICSYGTWDYKYTRPAGDGTYASSSDLNWLSIGVKKFKSIEDAKAAMSSDADI